MKTLIVDDSALCRRFVREALAEIPIAEVVGQASDGIIALTQIEVLKPDLVILDIHMPKEDGISVLRKLHARPNPPAVIVLSSDSESSIALTTTALSLGAFDFILKPSGGSLRENHLAIRDALRPRIEAIAEKRNSHLGGAGGVGLSPTRPATSPSRVPNPPAASRKLHGATKPEVVVIGISTGGPEALTKMLPELPSNFPLPILIVQHMPAGFTEILANDLNRICKLKVCEGREGQAVVPGTIYIAPGGLHMTVDGNAAGKFITIDDSPPEQHCRPSVNRLFRSAAKVYGSASLAVMMTGMGDDGTQGCEEIIRQKGEVIAQEEKSCTVYGMPRRVVEAGYYNEICSLNRIAERLTISAQVGTFV